MKKILSLFCAAALVLSASAAPVLPLRSAKTATKTAEVPVVKANLGLERLTPAKANGIKKAPATVKNDSIVADYVQGWFYEGEWLDSGISTYEIDFFNGEDFSAWVAFAAPVDSSKIAGTYTLTGGEVVVAEGDTTTIASGSLTISYEAASKNYHFVLKAICANGNTYNCDVLYAADELYVFDYELYMYYQYGYADSYLIELNDAPFVPTGETIEVVVENASTLSDGTSSSSDPYFQIIGEDDNYYASICVNTSKLIGTFANAAIDYDYTGLYLLSGDSETEVTFKSYDSNTVTSYTKSDTTVVEASLMAKDGNIYHIVLKNYVPTPTSTVNINFTDGEVDADTYSDYGVISFAAETDAYALSLLVYTNGAGTYTTDDIVGLNSSSYSYLGDYSTSSIITIVDVKLTLAADNSFTATLISSAACQYNITFVPAKTAVENTEAAQVKATKVIRDGQIVINKNGVEYNALGVQL